MIIHDVIQKSPEWFELRRKFPLTASEAQAIATAGKGLETLVWKKAAEVYSSNQAESFTNHHLERGNELEEQARGIYNLITGANAIEVGFVTNSKVSKVAGASPDGMITAENGLVEIKCFDDAKHFRNIIEIDIESKYQWQMQMQMLITGADWCDFVAYNPNFEESLLVQRVLPDKEAQKKIKAGLKVGEKMFNEIIADYEKRKAN